jgi:hypothetical protein
MRNRKVDRAKSLGSFAAVDDDLIIELLLSLLTPSSLKKSPFSFAFNPPSLQSVSIAFYVFAGDDTLWMKLSAQRVVASFAFASSWKTTYASTFPANASFQFKQPLYFGGAPPPLQNQSPTPSPPQASNPATCTQSGAAATWTSQNLNARHHNSF